MSEPIRFYGSEGTYACFSNFWDAPFVIEGVSYPTVEHFFQSQKFGDAEYREKIRTAATPAEAKTLGSARRPDYRSDWETVKENIMFQGIEAKFVQNEGLADILLQTGNVPIVEDSPTDYYWGIGADQSGQNRLGVIIEQVRASLQAKALPPSL
eukprot:TRINITY_DN5030_c0_g1_i1.p1 TRINITY_DN5030_c0_g1~~TRINITY_DN5030_c0_g1_i1.p1  ORF type:complete len:167 (-),score=47.14 TRINITY_DN5030_c0_g1_i1:44-505(-)